MKNIKRWKINYVRGYRPNVDVIVEAKNEAEAAKIGAAEYRRHYGTNDILSMHSVKQVVQSVVEVK